MLKLPSRPLTDDQGTIMQKTFTGSSQQEARAKANDWWVAQNGLRKVSQTEVAIGDEGPSLNLADRWSLTLHYEVENSH
jgi:hypothetical protein